MTLNEKIDRVFDFIEKDFTSFSNKNENIPFSLNNTRIWAFGNNGDIKFYNNSILMNSGGVLNDNQYMTLLVRFETDLFKLSNVSSKSFDMIYDEAMESISLKNKIEDIFYNEDGFTSFGIIIFVMVIFLILIFNPITLTIAYFIVFKGKKKRLYLRRCPLFNLNFGVDGRKLPDDKSNFKFTLLFFCDIIS